MEEFLLRFGALIISAASLFFAISSTRGKASADRATRIEEKIEKLKNDKAEGTVVSAVVGKLDILEDRAARLEGEMRHLPSREQTHELALALREMRGELGVLTERLKPISHTTERLQEFLIDEAKAHREQRADDARTRGAA